MLDLQEFISQDDTLQEGKFRGHLLGINVYEALAMVTVILRFPQPTHFDEDDESEAHHRIRYMKREALLALADQKFTEFLRSLFLSDEGSDLAVIIMEFLLDTAADGLSNEDTLDTPAVYLRAIAVQIGLNLYSYTRRNNAKDLIPEAQSLISAAKAMVETSNFRQQLFWFAKAEKNLELVTRLLAFRSRIFLEAKGVVDVPELVLLRHKFPGLRLEVIEEVVRGAKHLVNSLRPEEVTVDGEVRFRVMIDAKELKQIEARLTYLSREPIAIRMRSEVSPLGNLPQEVETDFGFYQRFHDQLSISRNDYSVFYPDLSDAELQDIYELENTVSVLTDTHKEMIQDYSLLYPLGELEQDEENQTSWSEAMSALSDAVADLNNALNNSQRVDTTRIPVEVPESLLFRIQTLGYIPAKFMKNNWDKKYLLIAAAILCFMTYNFSTYVPLKPDYPATYPFKFGSLGVSIAVMIAYIVSIAKETRSNVQSRAHKYQVDNQPGRISSEQGEWENDPRWSPGEI